MESKKHILSFDNFEFISEQTKTEFKLGDKDASIKPYQRALKNLGYNLGTSGKSKDGVDGDFGKLTQDAVIGFQNSKKLNPSGKLDSSTMKALIPSTKMEIPKISLPKLPGDYTSAKSDTFSPYDISAKEKGRQIEIMRKVKPFLQKNNITEEDFETGNWITKLIKKSMKSLPLHIRSVIYYIGGRKAEMNEDELTPVERSFLYKAALTHGLKKGFDYSYWKSLGAQNLPSAITTEGIKKETQNFKHSDQGSLTSPNLSGQFMYTLGSVSKEGIQKNKNTIVVNDNYDMNVVESNKQTEDLFKEVGEAMELWIGGQGTLYSVIRQSIALRELFGYKGYPVKFTLSEPNQIA